MNICPRCNVLVGRLRESVRPLPTLVGPMPGICLRCSGWTCKCGRPKNPEQRTCRFSSPDHEEKVPYSSRVLQLRR